jgi:hypothetical protein
MRPFLSERIADSMLRIAVIVTCALLCPALSVAADSDTTGAVSGERSLNIKIDESGIRIEGDIDDSTSVTTIDRPRRARPYRGPWRERGSDIVKFGEDAYVDYDELVRGDVVVFGADVLIEGRVKGNVVVMGGDAELIEGAEIEGDVVVLGGMLEEDIDVVIDGERVVLRDFPFNNLSVDWGFENQLFSFVFIPVQFFISLILSFLVVFFMKDRVVRGQQHVYSSVLKSFGAGFLVSFIGFFAVLLLFIVLLITLIGIPLAIILILACVGVFIIAQTVFVYALGLKVSDAVRIDAGNPFAVILVGTAVLYLPMLLGYGISLWPFGAPLGTLFKVFGSLLGTFGYIVGLGALFLSRFGARPPEAGSDGAVATVAPSPPPAPQAG